MIELSDYKNTHDYCYAFLLMKTDSYLPGVVVTIASLIRTKTTHDIALMVTEDISKKTTDVIHSIFKDRVAIVSIPYLKFLSKEMKTKKQQKYYSSWIASSYTKWNILAFPHKKVLFLDADLLIVKNIDHLFELKAPAGNFNNPFLEPFGQIASNFNRKTKLGSDGYPMQNHKIKPDTLMWMLTHPTMVLIGSTVLLAPSKQDYQDFSSMMKKEEPFGFPACFSGFDEQSIVYFYAMKDIPFHNIHHRYNLISWKNGFLTLEDIPYVLHYFSQTKPWQMKYNEWSDVITWYQFASYAVKKYKIKPSDIYLDKHNIESAVEQEDIFVKNFTLKYSTVLDFLK